MRYPLPFCCLRAPLMYMSTPISCTFCGRTASQTYIACRNAESGTIPDNTLSAPIITSSVGEVRGMDLTRVRHALIPSDSTLGVVEPRTVSPHTPPPYETVHLSSELSGAVRRKCHLTMHNAMPRRRIRQLCRTTMYESFSVDSFAATLVRCAG